MFNFQPVGVQQANFLPTFNPVGGGAGAAQGGVGQVNPQLLQTLLQVLSQLGGGWGGFGGGGGVDPTMLAIQQQQQQQMQFWQSMIGVHSQNAGQAYGLMQTMLGGNDIQMQILGGMLPGLDGMLSQLTPLGGGGMGGFGMGGFGGGGFSFGGFGGGAAQAPGLSFTGRTPAWGGAFF